MEEYFPADRLLELDIGSLVQIQSEDQAHNFSVNLVGVDNKQSIITTVPNSQYLPANTALKDIFIEGTTFEMRTIHNGRVVAFESSVIAIFNYRLLISSFPEMIETRRLRADVRLPCALSCDIRQNDQEAYGVISNISHGGCLLHVEKNESYNFIGEALNNHKAIEMEVFFPTEEVTIILHANVKSYTCQIDGACKVGLSFNYDYESVRKYLESLQLDSVSPFFS